jgi:hypothetical protein
MIAANLNNLPALTKRRPMAAARSSIWVSLWAALEAIGEARGRRQLLKIADECAATRPELASQLRAAARSSWL